MTLSDENVDRLLDALRLMDMHPDADKMAALIEHVRKHGFDGTLQLSPGLTAHFSEPEQCPGTDCLVSAHTYYVRCTAPDCGRLVRTYWDGGQHRKERHDRPVRADV